MAVFDDTTYKHRQGQALSAPTQCLFHSEALTEAAVRAATCRYVDSCKLTYLGVRGWQCGLWEGCDLAAVLIARVVGLGVASPARGLHASLLHCGEKGTARSHQRGTVERPRQAAMGCSSQPRCCGQLMLHICPDGHRGSRCWVE